MTKHEILDWIAGRYNSNNRSVQTGAFYANGEACRYFNDEGNRCAVSAMCKDDEETEKILREIDTRGSSAFGDNAEEIRPLLKEEFAGHDDEFYEACQRFHDWKHNWDNTGLTSAGKAKLADLKEQWV